MTSKDTIYLDHAAATPVADHVMTVMMPYLTSNFYNPSSPYAPAVQVRRDYEAAKQQLGQTIGAKGDDIIITAGATESINLAFQAVSGHVVTANIEHPAVLESAKQRDHTLIAVNRKGRVSVEAVVAAIQASTQLVSIAFANNELGTLQPIRKIAQAIESIRATRLESGNRTPLYFHCDASQGFGQTDINVARLGIDMLTLNSGKMYGPKQVALLWKKRNIEAQPLIFGGGQEGGVRSGTENVAGTIGFAAAATWLADHQPAEAIRLRGLRDTLEKSLMGAFDTAVVLGDTKHRLPGHLSIAFRGIDAERLIFILENEGIYIATGSACSANKHSASHVLTAIGLDEELIDGSVRLTLGKTSDAAAIQRSSQAITEAVQREYDRQGAS